MNSANVELNEVQTPPNFYDLKRHIDLNRELALSTGSTKLVIIPDVAYAVPDEQKHQLHGLPGYERVLITTLVRSTGFEDGAVVIVAAPPNPLEMAHLFEKYNVLRQQTDNLDYGFEPNMQVLFEFIEENGCQLVDLFKLYQHNPERYFEICSSYAQNVPNVSPDIYYKVLQRHSNSLISSSADARTFIQPFQVTAENKHMVKQISSEVFLPSMPIINKAYNYLQLKQHGCEQFTPKITVLRNTADQEGELVTQEVNDPEALVLGFGNGVTMDDNGQKFLQFANRLIVEMDVFKSAYVKLDAEGVSGLGNLDPREEGIEIFYDKLADKNDRINALKNIFISRDVKEIPPTTIIEENFLPSSAKFEDGTMRDYGAIGYVVNGEFRLTSIEPFATVNGMYLSSSMAKSPVDEVDTTIRAKIQEATEQVMNAIVQYQDYRNGEVCLDAMVLEQDNKTFRVVVHDFNLRGSGALEPQHVLLLGDIERITEAQIEVDLDEVDGLDSENLNSHQIFTIYTVVAHQLKTNYGIELFSSAFGYFGIHEDERFLKYKFLAPHSDKLRLNPNRPSEHLHILKQLVLDTITNMQINILKDLTPRQLQQYINEQLVLEES